MRNRRPKKSDAESLEPVVGFWVRENFLRGRRSDWGQTSAIYVRRYIAFSGARTVDGITRAAVKEWVSSLLAGPASRKTVSNMVGALSAFCGFLIDEGLIRENPCRRALCLPRTEVLPRYLDQESYDRVIALAGEHGILPEVATALWTGLRLGELRSLQWRDVRWAQKILLVREEGGVGRRTKGGRSRGVPMREALLELLSAHAARTTGNPRPETTALVFCRGQHWWQRALDPIRMQVPEFTSQDASGEVEWRGPGRSWHLLRHTFASRYVQAGGSVVKLSSWLGHRNISTTMVYAHLAPQHDVDIELV